MSKPLFGEFLVEKKIVSADQLAQGLVEQVSSLPSLIEIVHKKNLLTAEQILSATSHQTRAKIEFQASCKELGLWSSEIEAAVFNSLSDVRIPIGQLLVKQGAVDAKALTEALDDFLHIPEDAPTEKPSEAAPAASEEPVAGTAEPVTQVPASDSTAPTGGASLEGFEPKFPESDGDALKDCLSYLNQEKLAEITAAVDSWKTDVTNDTLGIAFKEVRTIRGLARFIQAELTEKLAAVTEELLAAFQKDLGFAKSAVAANPELINDAISVMWALKETLMKDGSEKVLWSDDAFRSKYCKLVGHIASTKPS